MSSSEMTTQQPTKDNQLSILDQQITELGKALAPAREDQVSARLMMLARAGLRWPSSIEEAKALEIYGFALAKVPYAGLKKATERLVAGEYPDMNRDFMPLPPTLAALARREASELLADRARLRERRESLSAGRPEPKSDEERAASIARVRDMVAGVRRQNAEFNASHRGLVPDMPLSPEQSAYWASILALPDRSDITAEQRESQSRIRGKIENEREEHG